MIDRNMNFITKNKFGNLHLYPNCDNSRVICDMLHAKTFLERNLKYLPLLGFSVIIDDEIIKDFK